MALVKTVLATSVLLAIVVAGPCPGEQRSCQGDLDKFCSAVEAGEGRVVKCLREHADELSDGCKKRLDRLSRLDPCLEDARRLCPNSRHGRGELQRCLRTHQTDVSAQCKRALWR